MEEKYLTVSFIEYHLTGIKGFLNKCIDLFYIKII